MRPYDTLPEHVCETTANQRKRNRAVPRKAQTMCVRELPCSYTTPRTSSDGELLRWSGVEPSRARERVSYGLTGRDGFQMRLPYRDESTPLLFALFTETDEGDILVARDHGQDSHDHRPQGGPRSGDDEFSVPPRTTVGALLTLMIEKWGTQLSDYFSDSDGSAPPRAAFS